MATPTLLGLPAELVVKVIDEIQPEDHINFAKTCRRLYQLSDDVLKSHRHWYRANSLRSDLDPLSIPKLLENIFFDPIAAWHIRDLEFWGLRRLWKQWVVEVPGSDEVEHGTGDEPEEPEALVDQDDPGKAAYVFTKDGVDRLMACFEKHLGYSAAAADVSRDLIMKGEEEPLKLLLVVLAPTLRSIKFPNLSFRNRRRSTMAHPLTLLSNTLIDYYRQSGVARDIWPPGLSSLRSVSIGVRTSRDRGFTYPFPFVAPLFLLPNLEYIYLDRPHSGFDQGESRFHLPRETSTVKHVHVTSCDLEITELSEMLAGIVALKSFSLQSLQRNGCDVIRLLGIHHGDTLEYLDMCDTDILYRLYENYFSRISLEGLRMFPNLKYIALDVLVLLYQHTETRYAHPGQLVTLKPHAEVDRVDLATFLSPSIEFIAFKISNSNYLLTHEVADALSKLVAKTIRSGAFPNLQAVFFEGITPKKPDANNMDGSDSNDVSWFVDAIVAGSGRIDVCTAWTHPGREMKIKKDELGIPRAVSARDMRTDGRNE